MRLGDICYSEPSRSLADDFVQTLDPSSTVFAASVAVPFDGVVAWQFRESLAKPEPQPGRASPYAVQVKSGMVLVGSQSAALYESVPTVLLLDQGDDLSRPDSHVHVYRLKEAYSKLLGDNQHAFMALLSAALAHGRINRSVARFPSQVPVRMPVEFSTSLVRTLWLTYQSNLPRLIGMYGAHVYMAEFSNSMTVVRNDVWSDVLKLTK